jgi:plastocyanin
MMSLSRRSAVVVLLGAGACLLAGPALVRLFAQSSAVAAEETAQARGQDQVPNRREFSITAEDFRFSPDRLEVTQDDLVRLTVTSRDIAYSVTIDEYRLSRRVPAGGSTTLEFRADRTGTFTFYSDMSDARHQRARGSLVVRPR